MAHTFIIGATGHIGGAILKAVVDRFPDLQVVALVRDHAKAEKLQRISRNIATRVGSLKDADIIESESAAARVVINASPDGLAESADAIKAALRGLATRNTKGFYIQTSGAYIIGEEVGGRVPSDKVWSDVSDVESIINMPPDRFHSRTDRIVRRASADVNVAIVSPTVVYGLSPAIERRIPITIRDLIETSRKLSTCFTMSQGNNILGYIHVEDLAQIFVSLLADAIQDGGSNAQLWGQQAYYFANGEEHTFSKYVEAVAKIMRDRGVISTEVLKQVELDSKDAEFEIVKKISAIHAFGANVRCRSDRATSSLGWAPKAPGLIDTLPGIVDLSLLESEV